MLTKNLYFYSLDNNMGALTYLADTAEAEESKEATEHEHKGQLKRAGNNAATSQ